jgi:iron complex transport system substrate-binding protein
MTLNPAPPAIVGVSKTLLAVAVLVTAGVGITGTAVYFDVRGTPGPTAGPNNVTVVDDLGRVVTAPLNASRLVVLAPSVMDVVYRLGLRDRVVGVGCTPSIEGGIENEYSPNQTTLWGLSNGLCVTDYPDLDTEEVAELDPGLVLASTITSATDIQTLVTTYRLPVVILAPSSLAGVVSDVALVARLYPSSAPVATTLEAALQQSLYNATSFDSNLSTYNDTIPSVFATYGFYTGTYYTFGPGTFGQSLVELAGGSSISSGVPLEYYGINASVVLEDQPAVILFGTSWNDNYLVAGQNVSVWETTAPYWSDLNGTKIPIDVTVLTEADPTMVLALPWFLHDLHPSLYPAPAGPVP